MLQWWPMSFRLIFKLYNTIKKKFWMVWPFLACTGNFLLLLSLFRNWFFFFSFGFGVRVTLTSHNELGCVPSSYILEEAEKDWYWFFFKCLVEFTGEAVWSWTFVFWDFWLVIQAPSWKLVCLDFLQLHYPSLENCMFLEIYLCLLDCPVCWYVIICSNPSWAFVFL